MDDKKDFSDAMDNWAKNILENPNHLIENSEDVNIRYNSRPVETNSSNSEIMTFEEYYENFDWHESAMDQMKLGKQGLEQGSDFDKEDLLCFLTYRYFIANFGTTGMHSKDYKYLLRNIPKRINLFEIYENKYKEFKFSRPHFKFEYLHFIANIFCFLFEEWYKNPKSIFVMGYTLEQIEEDLDYLIKEKHIGINDTENLDGYLQRYFSDKANFEWRQFDEEIGLYWMKNLLNLIDFCETHHDSILIGAAEYKKIKEYNISRDVKTIVEIIRFRLRQVEDYGLGGLIIQ